MRYSDAHGAKVDGGTINVARLGNGGDGHANRFERTVLTPQRITAGLLSLCLIALLGWTIIRGVGDVRTQIMLVVGVVLGLVFMLYGRLPDWLIRYNVGSLAANDDPANISPRVYLPIIGAVILFAVIASVVVVFLL